MFDGTSRLSLFFLLRASMSVSSASGRLYSSYASGQPTALNVSFQSEPIEKRQLAALPLVMSRFSASVIVRPNMSDRWCPYSCTSSPSGLERVSHLFVFLLPTSGVIMPVINQLPNLLPAELSIPFDVGLRYQLTEIPILSEKKPAAM